MTLFDERWDRDPSNLLQRIESAVYDHPQVLDDFSADIAVVAPRSIWVPAEYADDDEACAELYNEVYGAEPADLMGESAADAHCLYCLAPGLLPFLQRTFPGARLHCHLAVMARRFRERGSDIPSVFIDIRNGEADIVLFDNRRLLLAATHMWNTPEDLEYHLFNILNVYGLDPAETQVSLSGGSRP